MAQYDITYSCGHTGTVQIYGPSKDRERKIKYFREQGSCRACLAASTDTVRTAAATEAAKQAFETGLPALQGSDKQIAWAERIRAEVLPSIQSVIRSTADRGRMIAAEAYKAGIAELENLKIRLAAVGDVRTVALADAAAQASAKWWIENQNPDLYRRLARPIGDAVDQEFSDLADQLNAIKADANAKAKIERDARYAAQDVARRDERSASVVEAQTFEVGDSESDVVREGTNLIIRGRDGRVALGYIDGRDWAVYQIGDNALDSNHPEMERIAAEAKAFWEARP